MPTPAASADRNLLFGVLALQMDFVTRDALVAAMNAWAVEKGTPLGDILVRQGALRPELRALLDPLVAKHLEMHGGDPQRSLAAVSSISPSARAALAGVADRDVQASLLRLPGEKPAPAGPADPLATRAVSVLSKEATGLRYQVLRPHAKGGLGEVFVARDAETNREVALKEIQPHAAADPEARSRFLFEAEVTAGLEHPGVVPVYGLGAYPDGRPFYAMRFIRGDSLAQAIARFHSEQGKTLSDSERNLAFRDLLGRFVDVCETLAYAHARGVLHRDLKPGNVMLGRHGETLVVDWGLAKVTGRPDTHAGNGASAAPTPATPTAADEPALVPGSGSAPTQAGRLLGTPGYMSPEQAEGRLDRLGPASDVYGLGATLYHLLTGKPPVEGGDLGEVLRKVRTGEIPPPREANPEVPKPLDAICRKATALRPEDRYATAADLAADVEKFLADEAVSALADSPLDRAGRWARRNRSAVRTGVVAALIFFTAVFAAERWYANEQAERAAEQAALDVERAAERNLIAAERRLRSEQARDDVNEAIARAAELRDQARWDAAANFLTAAERRLVDASDPALAERVRVAKLDLDVVRELDEIRLRKATVTKGRSFDPSFANGRAGAYAQAFGRYLAGRAPDGPGLFGDPAEVAEALRSSTAAPLFAAGLDDWALDETDPGLERSLLDLDRLLDPDPLRDRLRDPNVRSDAAALRALAADADVEALPPATTEALATLLGRAGQPGEAADLLRRASARRPDDFGLHFELALLCDTILDLPAEAVEHYRAALAIRPTNAPAYSNLGNLLAGLGRTAEAEAAYRRAVEADPALWQPRRGLGELLFRQARYAESAAEYEAAMDRLPPDDTDLHESVEQRRGTALALAPLEPRFAALLAGGEPPADPAEAIALAEHFAYPRGRFALAARLYVDAFRDDPALADDLAADHRYWAACCAALAAAGAGEDAVDLTDDERTAWRRQALHWLRADLAARQGALTSRGGGILAWFTGGDADATAVIEALRAWQADPDLASVRALAALPPDERAEWKALWRDVTATIRDAAGPVEAPRPE